MHVQNRFDFGMFIQIHNYVISNYSVYVQYIHVHALSTITSVPIDQQFKHVH